jgi:hypothetical protein
MTSAPRSAGPGGGRNHNRDDDDDYEAADDDEDEDDDDAFQGLLRGGGAGAAAAPRGSRAVAGRGRPRMILKKPLSLAMMPSGGCAPAAGVGDDLDSEDGGSRRGLGRGKGVLHKNKFLKQVRCVEVWMDIPDPH